SDLRLTSLGAPTERVKGHGLLSCHKRPVRLFHPRFAPPAGIELQDRCRCLHHRRKRAAIVVNRRAQKGTTYCDLPSPWLAAPAESPPLDDVSPRSAFVSGGYIAHGQTPRCRTFRRAGAPSP